MSYATRRKFDEEEFLEYQKTGGICFFCKDETPYHSITADHLHPRSRRFTLKNNKIFSCRWCNSIKTNLTVYQFRELLSHAFVWYAKRDQQDICRKVLRAIKTCSELIKDKNGILYSQKHRFTRKKYWLNPYPYTPQMEDIYIPKIPVHYGRVEERLIKQFPHWRIKIVYNK